MSDVRQNSWFDPELAVGKRVGASGEFITFSGKRFMAMLMMLGNEKVTELVDEARDVPFDVLVGTVLVLPVEPEEEVADWLDEVPTV